MRKLVVLFGLLFSMSAFAANQSSINPQLPSNNSPLTSQVVRGNFLASYNDINSLWAAVAAGGGGGGGASVSPPNGSIQFNNNGVLGGFSQVPIASGGTNASTAQGALNNLNTTPVGSASYVLVPCNGGGDESQFIQVAQPAAQAQHTSILYPGGTAPCQLNNQWLIPTDRFVSLFGWGGGAIDFNTARSNGGSAAPFILANSLTEAQTAPGAAAIDIHGARQLNLNGVNMWGTSLSEPSTLITNSSQDGTCCASNNLTATGSSFGSTNAVLGTPLDGNFNPILASGVYSGTITSSGSGYVPGTYNKVALTGGAGTNAFADTITVNGSGAVSAVLLRDGNGIQYPGGGYTANVITAGTITNAGTGYTDGTYTNISLTGGVGSGAKATIVVTGGSVVSVTITTVGNGYAVNDFLSATGFGAGSSFLFKVTTVGGSDVLSASNTDLGGSGSGFQFTLTGLTKATPTAANTLPRFLGVQFSDIGTCILCNNFSDLMLWNFQMSGFAGIGIEPIFGGGGLDIGPGRAEFGRKWLWLGGPNGSTINSARVHDVTLDFVGQNYDTAYRTGNRSPIEIDSGDGYLISNLQFYRQPSTDASIKLGGTGANAKLKGIIIDDISEPAVFGGGSQASCVELNNGGDGTVPDFVIINNLDCVPGNDATPVKYNAFPTHFIEDSLGSQHFTDSTHTGLGEYWDHTGRPWGISSTTSNTPPNANATMDLSGDTKALLLPTGTTGQRPTATNGMIRFNSSTPGVEVFYSSTWNTLSGGAVTWPATGSIVVSNTTNTPAGIAEVDGNCVVGSAGAWVSGSCSGSSNITLGTTAAATNPQRGSEAGTGFFTPATKQVAVAANSIESMQWETVVSGVDFFDVTPGLSGTAPLLSVGGSTSNQSLAIAAKGSGFVDINSPVLQIFNNGVTNAFHTQANFERAASTAGVEIGYHAQGSFADAGWVGGGPATTSSLYLTSRGSAGATITDLFLGNTGTTTPRVGVGTASPGATLDVAGQIRTSGTTPTIASNACGSGTQGTITGTDFDGQLTVGTASVTSCAVSFSATYTNAPRSCQLTPANSTAAAWNTTGAFVSAISTSSWTITGLALDSAIYYYHCQ